MSVKVYSHIPGSSCRVLTSKEQLRKELSMSYMVAVKQENLITITIDSRENFSTYFNDNYQKIFHNDNVIWASTGIIKYNNIDYVVKIKEIMNQTDISIENKIRKVILLMEDVTSTVKANSIFNMFLGYLADDNRLILRVIDIVRGELVGDQYVYNNSIYEAGALSFLGSKVFRTYDYQSANPVAFSCGLVGIASYLNNTIGGETRTISIDTEKNISTYINGKEAKF